LKGSGLRTVLESFAIKMCPDLSCHPGTFLQVSFPLSVASVFKKRNSAFFYLDQNCTNLKNQARKITFLLANYYLSKKKQFFDNLLFALCIKIRIIIHEDEKYNVGVCFL